jgi:hypothetical protein
LVAFGLPPLSTPIIESMRPMDIDLPPGEYSSERKKPREPFFGPGLPDALAYLFGMFSVMALLYLFRH